MSAEDEHILYPQAFGHDSTGHPVINPPDTDFLKPGSIRYFNDIGEWMPLDIPSWSEFLTTMKSNRPTTLWMQFHRITLTRTVVTSKV